MKLIVLWGYAVLCRKVLIIMNFNDNSMLSMYDMLVSVKDNLKADE
jgi:hypothetical protein